MAIYLAREVLQSIDYALEADQGACYRYWLEKVIPYIGDAYSTDTFPFRNHMGASIIGRKCPREIWYNFRWSKIVNHNGKMLRLFNRGHLEEARFIALLLMIGVVIYQQDETGKQFKISVINGHGGGSTDGVAIGVPGLDLNTPCLCEFKTHNEKSFTKLIEQGVQITKPEHYVQMQMYMKLMGLSVALYMAVNKNTDQLHAEFILLNNKSAEQYIKRWESLILMQEAPKKINNSPGWYECKWCNYKTICHLDDKPHINCRTCTFVTSKENGSWVCNMKNITLNKKQQFKACNQYKRGF